MSQQETPQDAETGVEPGREPEAGAGSDPGVEPGSDSLTDDLDGFDDSEPTESTESTESTAPTSTPSQDDWPEGEPDADVDEAVVTAEDQVGPAVGERFADLHAERPWLLPALAASAGIAIVGLLALLRRR